MTEEEIRRDEREKWAKILDKRAAQFRENAQAYRRHLEKCESVEEEARDIAEALRGNVVLL